MYQSTPTTNNNNFEALHDTDYQPFLVENGQATPINMDQIDDQLRLLIDPAQRHAQELAQADPRFGKEIVYFSTPKKSIFDANLKYLFERKKRGEMVTILHSLYSSGNPIVPWLYFAIIYDSTNRDYWICYYYLKTIKSNPDHFEILLDVHQQRLTFHEVMELNEKICVEGEDSPENAE